MTPLFALFLGFVAFIGLIAAGFKFDWPFGAGVAVVTVAFVAAVIWLYWYAFGEVK
jgi:hypothetical protein